MSAHLFPSPTLLRSTARALVVLLAGVAASPHTLQAQTPAPGTVWPDEGPAAWAPRPTESAITANDLRTHLYQLAADSMMGRQAATLGNWMATDYIAAQFRRLGLEPAGVDGTYFQEIDYGLLAYERGSVRLELAGRTLAVGTEWAPMPDASELAADYSGVGVPAVFGGTWGNTAAALPAEIVQGKAVVFLMPSAQAGVVRTPQQVFDPRARDGGAALVLVASTSLAPETVAAGLDGRMGTPAIQAAGTAGAVITTAAAAGLFAQPLAQLAVGTEGREVSGAWRFEYHRPVYPARNVIAVLRGSDPALRGQYVLVGAHNDHVGKVEEGWVDHDSVRAFNTVMRPQGANDRPGSPTRAQQAKIDSLITYARSIRPPRRDSIMNGADDDGSGTAVLLEIAERFASQAPPARSIIFISHTAEEAGLRGSAYFTEHPTLPLDSIVAAHNMDMLGKGRATDVEFGGPTSVQMLGSRRLSAEFGDMIDSLNAVRDEPMAIDYSWDRTNALNRFCRSDQVSYFRKTIPVTYFSLGYSRDYHQATDEPQYVDFEHGARLGRFVYDIMRTAANRSTRLAVLPFEQRDLSAQCTG